MKKIVAVVALTILSVNGVYAQNAGLTKTETVEYLKKKMIEVNGQTTPTTSANKFITYSFSCAWVTDGFQLYMADLAPGQQDYQARVMHYVFNPAYIKDVVKGAAGESTGWVKLVFASNAVSDKVKKTSTNEAWYPYMVGDGTNFEKVRKAWLYLRDLIKAEDDPFK